MTTDTRARIVALTITAGLGLMSVGVFMAAIKWPVWSAVAVLALLAACIYGLCLWVVYKEVFDTVKERRARRAGQPGGQ